MPVRVKKTRQNKGPEPGSDSLRTDKAPGGGVQRCKSALKIGLEVIGVKHGGTVENRGIDKTILRLGVAARRHPCGPAFTSRVSAFCGLDGPSFEKLVRLPPPRTLSRSRKALRKHRRAASWSGVS